MSQLRKGLEFIRTKYEGKIVVGNTGQNYLKYAAALKQLLTEWNPVGCTAEEVQFVIGAASETNNTELIYSFENGYSLIAWRFKLKNGKIVELQKLPSDINFLD